jgi:hypothetical protein
MEQRSKIRQKKRRKRKRIMSDLLGGWKITSLEIG